jgi:hypothetical protein
MNTQTTCSFCDGPIVLTSESVLEMTTEITFNANGDIVHEDTMVTCDACIVRLGLEKLDQWRDTRW